MKKCLSLIGAVAFVIAISSSALAQNRTATTPSSKANAIISTTAKPSKSEAKTIAKPHAVTKPEHAKNKHEKKL